MSSASGPRRPRRPWSSRGSTSAARLGPDTAPGSRPRQQTRPLPVAADQPPGDDRPTVVGLGGPPVQPPAPPREQVPFGEGPYAPLPLPPPPAGSGATAAAPRKLTVTRVAAVRSRELSGAAVRRVRAASRADGAGETGLSQLLWVNALQTAGDALIAVSLAGTLFFAAASDAQRGNVALYLLVTMAPFAVLAPVIGPLLDRLQRGRRLALAVSFAARAVLAVVMAAHFDDFVLYPAALGVLVCSKAFNVLRAAVVPRVLPPALTLTSANARLSVFGLAAGGLLGALGAGVAKVFGFGPELWVTAVVFAAGAVLSLRLPRHVDVPAGEEQADVLRTAPIRLDGGGRRRPTTPHVATALRATAALRGLSGFLTIFSAFLVQASIDDGWHATAALGAIAAAAGVGSFAGTAAGSRLQSSPDRLVLVAAGVAAGVTVVAAVFYSFPMAALVAFVAAVTNAVGKVSLDAIIQREVPDALRASAFARSETWLQLAWVVGGALGIALPSTGWLGFTVAAALLVLTVGLTLWSLRTQRAPAPPDRPEEWT